MFGLSDPAILHTLAKKIEEKVPLTIFYDAKSSPNLRTVLAGAQVYPLRQAGLMHQKILILDDERVFLGSANFTTPSLKMHDNLVVGLSSPAIAQFLKEKKPYSSGSLSTVVGGQQVDIWLLPDRQGEALSTLKKQISLASRTLQIALFTLTHSDLTEAIIQAKKRGVAVTVLLDTHAALGASASAIQALREAGVRLLYSQGVQLLHHKFAYIDQKTLIMGSANWTKAAFTKNSDCLMILHDLNPEQKKFLRRLWNRMEKTSRLAFLRVFFYHESHDPTIDRLLPLPPHGPHWEHSVLH